jgi:NAD(P)-dependent dehydrogenase (short-subunit alcohol dehydrogenase family)
MLKDRVMFMSGGSRGIGLAIAARAARDGVKVALMAKTAEPHPKLPGTIYTAAEEIEAAGGEALPIVGDIRDADAVETAVAQTVERFGGIDLALRPDAADQPARDVRGHARVPAAPARVGPRARVDAVPAVVRRPALAEGP